MKNTMQLEGKTVRYLADKSSVTENKVRIFKIEEVEQFAVSAKGKEYVTVKARDIDDQGESKIRNLSLDRIDLSL
ncbi:hypothetical protein N9955_00605 [bacterium]|nr:hypothetical protein [bacterium]